MENCTAENKGNKLLKASTADKRTRLHCLWSAMQQILSGNYVQDSNWTNTQECESQGELPKTHHDAFTTITGIVDKEMFLGGWGGGWWWVVVVVVVVVVWCVCVCGGGGGGGGQNPEIDRPVWYEHRPAAENLIHLIRALSWKPNFKISMATSCRFAILVDSMVTWCTTAASTWTLQSCRH